MGPEPGVVEISSGDEEEEQLGWDLSGEVSFDWLDEIFSGVDKKVDDVIVLDEPAAEEKNSGDSQDLKSNSSAKPSPAGDADDGSDDDCLVLDGDPDAQFSAIEDGKSGGDGSDDLLIVGEKGQLACRDYPHPRHLCANFPFSTTPHEKYCTMCHCYVCDSRAPCKYWGSGVSSTDHCHSTDKEARWKNDRKSFKHRNKHVPTQHLSALLNTTRSIVPPSQNPQTIHSTDPIMIPTLSSRPNPLRSCSGTGVPIPAVINQRHHQPPVVSSYHGQRLGHHQAKAHLLFPAMQNVQRQRHGGGAFAAQIIHDHSTFKRVKRPGTHLVNLKSSHSQTAVSGHDQMYRDAALQRHPCPPALAENGTRRWQDILAGLATELGVAEDTHGSTTYRQPHTVPSQSSSLSHFHTQMTAAQVMGPVNHSSAPISRGSLGFDSNWSRDTTPQNIPDSGLAAQPLSIPDCESNLATGEISVETFLADVVQETASGSARQLGQPDTDPVPLLYDLDVS